MAGFTNIDKKYIAIYILLVMLSIAVLEFNQVCFDVIKTIITFEYFGIAISIGVFALTAIHKVKFNNYGSFSKIEFQEFKSIMSDLISTVMDPATFICSVSLLKGLFLKKFYGIKYFDFFTDNELTFIFIASVYFLIKSSLEIKTLFVECFKKTTNLKQAYVNTDNTN